MNAAGEVEDFSRFFLQLVFIRMASMYVHKYFAIFCWSVSAVPNFFINDVGAI